MSDKPVAVFTTAMIVAPLAVLCCLAPILGAAVLGGVVGWVAGLSPVYLLGAAVIAGAVLVGLARRPGAQEPDRIRPAKDRRGRLSESGL